MKEKLMKIKSIILTALITIAATSGDLRRVTAKEAYPENYNKVADRAKNEKEVRVWVRK
ncbi:MAG: hypothetical protein ACI4LR_04935 [Treponema sp.]